jgi:flagellar biosynthesis protein FlhG
MENQSFTEQPQAVATKRAHVVVFTSGKGGVGKTSVTCNVATAMVQRGAKVCVFDASAGMSNITSMLGLRSECSLEHILNGEKSIQEVMIKTPQGVTIIPDAAAITDYANLNDDAIKRLCNALVELEKAYDYFLIDTATGVSDSVLQFIESAPYTFLLVTPDPTSLTDGFTLLKSLNSRNYPGRIRVVVNMAEDYPHATDTYRRFSAAVDQYLQLAVDYGGFVALDDNIPQAIAKQTPLVELTINGPASRCLIALADNLLKYIGNTASEIGLANYWEVALKSPQKTITDSAVTSSSTSTFEVKPQTQTIPNQQQGLTAIGRNLLAAMQSQTNDQGYFEAFTAEYLEAFQAQFGHYPHCFKPLLFRWLEAEAYAAPQLQDLASTLEMLYMAKHQQPMHSLESCAARLIAQCNESEPQMRELIAQFRSAYHQAFQTDVFDTSEELVGKILSENFQEQDFQVILNSLNAAFEQRFDRPYQNKNDAILISVLENLTEMADEEIKLQQQLDTLQHSVHALNQRRDYLLKTLQQH